FLALDGKSSLFQQAVERLAALDGHGIKSAAPLVVGNDEHRFLLLEQLRELKVTAQALLLEPVGRNTAPAPTLAALAAPGGGAEPRAEQTATGAGGLWGGRRSAVTLAGAGAIVTTGMGPPRPETGYGYIRAETPGGASRVQGFVEKPDAATAERYLRDGGYLW